MFFVGDYISCSKLPVSRSQANVWVGHQPGEECQLTSEHPSHVKPLVMGMEFPWIPHRCDGISHGFNMALTVDFPKKTLKPFHSVTGNASPLPVELQSFSARPESLRSVEKAKPTQGPVTTYQQKASTIE